MRKDLTGGTGLPPIPVRRRSGPGSLVLHRRRLGATENQPLK